MSGFYTSTDDQYRHYCRDVVDTRMRFSNETCTMTFKLKN